MKNKKHNPETYMVDVFYEKNKKRNKPENNDPKKVVYFRFLLKMVLIIAAIVLVVTFLPAKLIKPNQSSDGDTVLINEAPDAEPIEEDGTIPDESIWRENISPIDIEDKIYLAWDDPSNRNWTLTEMPPNVNVLAPVWFKLEFVEDE